MIGTTLGNRYTILEEISGGGMAVVYKAKCNLLNRIVAIKILKSEFADDEDFVRRFRREAQAAASLSHPNIVGIYDVGQEKDLYYIVMEYVEGYTLKELIRHEAPMVLTKVVEIGIQICDALECAHKNKIVHRDIKSQNIMITSDGRVKVTDFGIARATGGATITNTGNVFGSVQYFSPEQARSDMVDERSDIYSVGIVMYEAFTGRLPFNGQTPVAIALKQIQEKPEFIYNIIAEFPKNLEGIVQKCLHKSPEDRYQNAKILKEDLLESLKTPEVANFQHKNIENTLIIDEIKNNFSGSNSVPINKKPKNIPKILGIATLCILIFFTFSYLGTILARKYFEVPEAVVPDVIGKQEEQAIEELEKRGLKYSIVDRVFDTAPAGQIIDQNPKGDQKIKVNHPSIDLVISKGPKAGVVPKIVGLNEQEGIVLLRSRGFEEGRITREHNSDISEGIIIDQNPRDGLTLSEGESINFKVSLGPELVDVPDLVGKTLEEARKLLDGKGITLSGITEKPDQAPENTVIDQNPKPNEAMEPNKSIDVVISSGSIKSKKLVIEPIFLPSETDETTVKIIVSDALGDDRTVYLGKHNSADSPISIPIEGAGDMEIEVWLDGILYFKGQG